METRTGENLRKRKLDTKGCCFLCLKLVYFKSEDNPTVGTVSEPASIRSLQRYLNINVEELLKRVAQLPSCSKSKLKSDAGHLNGSHKTNLSSSSLKKDEDFEADLCVTCSDLFKRFSGAFSMFELIQMEVNYFLDKLHQQISDASKRPELVHAYNDRMLTMTETDEGLGKNEFVDDLRNEIKKKSSKKTTKALPTLKLRRLKPGKDYQIGTGSALLRKPALFSKEFPCYLCNKYFQSMAIVKRHQESVHFGKRHRHTCDICTVAIFPNLDSLAKHKETCKTHNRLVKISSKYNSLLTVFDKKRKIITTKKNFLRHLKENNNELKKMKKYPKKIFISRNSSNKTIKQKRKRGVRSRY